MKKVLSMMLVLCMVLAMFAGCGSTASTAEATASEASSVAEAPAEAPVLLSDIATYVSEAVPGFIMGTKSLDEWDAYCADLEAMDLDAAVAIYQAAYDRYLG